MAIQRSELKIFKPEQLGNERFAGGYRTNNEVISGKLNDVFSSISDIDYARSAFDLVKLFPALNTSDNSRLQDGYIYIAEQPSDPLVQTLIVENPRLNDGHVLADMQDMLIEAPTKFHGATVALADITDKTISVENVNVQVVPIISQISEISGFVGYTFDQEPIDTKRVTRSKFFTAPESANVSFITIAVPDFIDKKTPWDYSSKKWEIKYLSSIGFITTNSEDSTFNGNIIFNNGNIELTLNNALQKGATLEFKYKSTSDYRFHYFALTPTLNLASNERIVPKTFKLKKAGTNTIYTDNGDGLFIDSTDNVFAQINYDTGIITPLSSVDLTSTVSEGLGCMIFMSTAENQQYPSDIRFRLENEKSIIMDSVYLRFTLHDNSQFSVSSTSSGELNHANIVAGSVQPSTQALVQIQMASGIKVKQIQCDYQVIEEDVAQSHWYGFDVTALPNKGLVPAFHQNNVVCISNTSRIAQDTLTNGQVVNVLADADYVDIMDSTGASLYSVLNDNYLYDKATGDITINAGIVNFTAPFVITAIQSERSLISNILDNEITLLTPVTRTYPAGSMIASVQVIGDLQALVKNERTASTFNDDFDFNLDGTYAPASGNFNTVQYPIEVNNIGAINQKWAIEFTSDTAFKVTGETVGIIHVGDITTDLAPINNLVDSPFFIIRQQAFGAGLAPGEVFLFETVAASKPIMLSRSVSPGHSNVTEDQSTIAFFGNSD